MHWEVKLLNRYKFTLLMLLLLWDTIRWMRGKLCEDWIWKFSRCKFSWSSNKQPVMEITCSSFLIFVGYFHFQNFALMGSGVVLWLKKTIGFCFDELKETEQGMLASPLSCCLFAGELLQGLVHLLVGHWWVAARLGLVAGGSLVLRYWVAPAT